MSATTSTPFPLAVFTGNPDAPGSAAEATFDANNETFDSLMGATPIYQNTYIDASQAPADWASNASYFAGVSQTAATFDGSIPVIGLPMGSTNADAPSTAQILENFTDGTYDSMLQSMVKSWADAGFMTQYWRPGVEMNLGSTPGFVGGDASLQALWVSAFQNIYTVLHAAATADGVDLKSNGIPARPTIARLETRRRRSIRVLTMSMSSPPMFMPTPILSVKAAARASMTGTRAVRY